MFSGSERRQYKRIKKPFVTRFQILSEKGDGRVFPGWDMVTTQNLGAGGILFNYDEKIKLNSALEFKINFPTLNYPIDCKGRVVRVEEAPHSSRVRIAAVFTDMNDNEKNEVNRFAEEVNSREPEYIER